MLALSTIVVPLNTTAATRPIDGSSLHARRMNGRTFVQQHGKFIATEARENVVAAYVERHAMRHVAQQTIAGLVSE